jgi:hypothetical protein
VLAAAIAGRLAAQKPHCADDHEANFRSMGERMRGLLAVMTVAVLVALSASANAQGMGAGLTSSANRGQSDRPGGAPPPQEKQAPRANDKDYKSSLGRLPDKKYDPWANTR